jgi:peptidoglycan/xylan/chitin deacetylase (PgdA/CDA1 family)
VKLAGERFDYSPIVSRPRLRLPGRARLVVWTIVNVEDWEITAPMPRTVLPPPAGGTGLPDVPNWAWHDYGMRVGFWRLKAALDRYCIKATLAINGSVCVSYKAVADAARDAGWEFMGHGYVQRSLHAVPDEREVVGKSVDAIRAFTGRPPRGWLGPGLTETWETLDILAEAGLEYVCDWVNDDQPYEIKTRAHPLVMIPYTVEVNDIPVVLIQHHEGSELLRRARDQFDRLYAEGQRSARVMAIAVHPYISGVPHRIKYFEQMYAYMTRRPGVLFWKGEEVLDWYRSTSGAVGAPAGLPGRRRARRIRGTRTTPGR